MFDIKADRIYIQDGRIRKFNKKTMKEEIDQDAELDRIDDNSGDENPYRELIVNNAGKVESTLAQME